MNYISFPVIDIVSSQIYCDYLEENQYINSCLREELKEEFEEKQIYTIPDNDERDGYGDVYGNGYDDGNGVGCGDGVEYGDGYRYGDGVGYGDGYGYDDEYGFGYGDGNGNGDGRRDEYED